VLGAADGDRHDARAGFQRQAPDAAPRGAERAAAHAGALGEDHDAVPAREDRPRGRHRLGVAGAAVDGEGAERVQQPRLPAPREQLALGDVVDGAARQRADHEGVEEAAVVGGEQQWPAARDVLGADALQAQVQEKEGQQHRAHGPVDQRADAVLARAGA
jgi:hypothetical protein